MISLYGTAPGLLSSEGSRFCLVLQMILLTHWDLVPQYNFHCIDIQVSIHGAAFCNTVQGVLES